MKFTYKIRDGKRLLEIGDIVADSERDAIMDVLRKDDLSFEPKADQRYVIEVGDTVAGAFGDEFAEVATVASYTSGEVIEYTDGFMYVPETEGVEYPDCQYEEMKHIPGAGVVNVQDFEKFKEWLCGDDYVTDVEIAKAYKDYEAQTQGQGLPWDEPLQKPDWDQYVFNDITLHGPDGQVINQVPTSLDEYEDLKWQEIRRSMVTAGQVVPTKRPSLTVLEKDIRVLEFGNNTLKFTAPACAASWKRFPTFLLKSVLGYHTCWVVDEVISTTMHSDVEVLAKRWGS